MRAEEGGPGNEASYNRNLRISSRDSLRRDGMDIVSAPVTFLRCACAKGGWGAEEGSGDTA